MTILTKCDNNFTFILSYNASELSTTNVINICFTKYQFLSTNLYNIDWNKFFRVKENSMS